MNSLKSLVKNVSAGVLVGCLLFVGLVGGHAYAVGPCEPDPDADPPVTCTDTDPGGGGGGSAGSDAAASACEGVATLGVTCGTAGDAKSVISGPVKTIIQLLSFVVGVASIVMIIYGGFRFITSGGNSDATKSARNTIIYALVGLLIVLIANLLITFVFNQAKELNGASGGGAGGSSDCVPTEAVPCPTSPPTTD